MNIFLILPIALALAMDAFAVSVGISIHRNGLSPSQVFRLAFGFGIFQFMMPLFGWQAGQVVIESIKAIDHWVAFGLLAVIGFKMIYESLKSESSDSNQEKDPTKGLILLVLSVATSIDALAVGLSFAALELPVFVPSLIIGIVAFFLTIIGAKIGPLFGRVLGRRAELLGGCLLILIGIKILMDHI
ncbi:manganese efflux pump MntP family protein [Acidobacteriota bacterium]